MEGGIGIILLLIIAIVVVVGGAALYITGGSLWFSRTRKEGGEAEGTQQHKEPRDTTMEKTEFAGVHHDREE
jgi:hypothetical protein